MLTDVELGVPPVDFTVRERQVGAMNLIKRTLIICQLILYQEQETQENNLGTASRAARSKRVCFLNGMAKKYAITHTKFVYVAVQIGLIFYAS